MSWFFASGGQSIGVSASASVLPMNIQDWSPLGWTGWISLQSRDSLESSPIPQFKSINSSVLNFLYSPTLTSILTTGKTIALTRWTFFEVMSLLFNMLSRLIIAFLPKSKCLLILWLLSPSAMILEPPKIVCHCFHCFPIYLPWSNGTGCHDLSFLNVEWVTLKFSVLQLVLLYYMKLVQFCPSVMSDSLWPHELHHTRLPCPSPIPGACSNSCPSSWWCHPTISSSVVPYSFCLQSFPALGSFPMSQFFTSGGQSIGVSYI